VEVNRAWKHPQECRDEAALLRRQRHFLMGARIRNPALAHIQTGPRRRRSRPQRGTRVKVYFVSKVEKTTDADEVRHVPFLKEYTVFNVAQCHGLPEECLTGEATALNLDQRNAEAQDFITVTGADFREGHGEAYYAPGADFIAMPSFENFKDADCFYATSFHELGHNADIRIMPRRT
jgi:antirestriction protein ArdC